MTRLSYPFRTLIGPWMALVMLGFGINMALSENAPFLGEGMWTVRWMALILWLVWPVLAGAAAIDAARLSRPGNQHLVLASAKGWKAYPWAVAWTAGPAATVHVLVIAVLLAVGGVTNPRGGWEILILAVAAQVSTLIWFACLGSMLGRYLPTIAAGAVAAILSIWLGSALTNYSSDKPAFTVLGDAGASVTQIGVTWNATHLWAQLGLLTLTSLLMVLPLPRLRRGVLAPSIVAIGVVAVSVGCSFAAQAFVPGKPLNDQPVPTDVCTQDGLAPQICYYQEHERFADETIDQIRTLTDAAERRGYSALVLEQVHEASRRPVVTYGNGVAEFPTLGPDPVDSTDVIQYLVMPEWCEELSGHEGPPDSYWHTLDQVMYTWATLAGIDYVAFDGDTTEILTPDEVAQIIDDWSRCDFSEER